MTGRLTCILSRKGIVRDRKSEHESGHEETEEEEFEEGKARISSSNYDERNPNRLISTIIPKIIIWRRTI